jgi:hypothetical protein
MAGVLLFLAAWAARRNNMQKKTLFPQEVLGERHSGVPLRKKMTAKDLKVTFNKDAWKQAIDARVKSTGQK